MNYSLNHISDHGDGTRSRDSYTTHDLVAEFRTPNIDVTVGVVNLTDEDPVTDSIQGWTTSNEQFTFDCMILQADELLSA